MFLELASLAPSCLDLRGRLASTVRALERMRRLKDGVDLHLESSMVRNSVSAYQREGFGLTGCQLGDYAVGRTQDLAALVVESGLERGSVLNRVVVGCFALDLSAVAAGHDVVVADRDLLRWPG